MISYRRQRGCITRGCVDDAASSAIDKENQSIEGSTSAVSTDPVENILADLRVAIDREMAVAIDRIINAAASAMSRNGATGQASDELKLISVGAAGHHANLTDDRIRQLCREHPYGSSSAGFGYKRGGRWQVVDHIFRQYLARRPA